MSYYKTVTIPLLRSDTKDKLIDYVINNPDCILKYYRVAEDNTQFYVSNKPRNKKDKCVTLQHIDIDRVSHIVNQDVEFLKDRISIPFRLLILYVPPLSIVPPHKDSRTSERQCTIIDPVYPKDFYTPTWFFSKKPEGEPPEASCVDFPALINIQEYHMVKTNQEFRLNFQVYFGLPYTFSVVSNMIDNGTLFKY
jgi:hypothetical protein